MRTQQNNGHRASGEKVAGSSAHNNLDSLERRAFARRSFLKGLAATSAVLLPTSALLMSRAQAQNKSDDSGGKLSNGDAAILRFLAAAEILESDLWEQYWELGGVPFGESVETPRGENAPIFSGGNPLYTSALTILDSDMPQYI